MSQPWRVVWGLLLILAVSSGLGFYNMSVYVTELSRSLGVKLSDISVAVSLFFVSGGIFGVYLARLIDQVDIRVLMCGGSLLAGIALVGVAFADALWQIYVLFVLFGLGNTGVGLVVNSTLITRWFPGRDRSLALSISSTGLSLGGALLTPVTAYGFNLLDVPTTMTFVGIAFAGLTIPVILLVIRMPVQSEAPMPAADRAAGYRSVVRSRLFIGLTAGYVLAMASQVGGIAHLYGRVELIADFETASMAVQALSLGSILGRFVGGYVASRVPIALFAFFCMGLQVLGLAIVALVDTPWAAVAAAGFFGVSVGNVLMSQPLWLAEVVPSQIYPRVFALSSAIGVFGLAFGPYTMGLLADTAGYASAYWLAVVVSVCALGAFVLATRGET